MSARTLRDVDRRQVYRAEELSAELTILDEPRSVAELVFVVDRLRSGAWWRTHFGTRPLAVRINRSLLRSYWDPNLRCVSLSPSASDLSTLCHELAHVAATDLGHPTGPPHGPIFRSLHVSVRHAVLGRRAGDDLAEVYGQFGLPVGPFPGRVRSQSAWSEPVLDPADYSDERVVGVDRIEPWSPRSNRLGPIAL